MNPDIERAEKQFYSASNSMAATVAKYFPVGTFVLVKWSKGYMPARVFCTARGGAYPGSVGVESTTTGGRHWRYWRDLEAKRG